MARSDVNTQLFDRKSLITWLQNVCRYFDRTLRLLLDTQLRSETLTHSFTLLRISGVSFYRNETRAIPSLLCLWWVEVSQDSKELKGMYIAMC